MKREAARKILAMYSLFVILVSILPIKEPHIKEFTFDKIIHFFIYFIMTYFCILSFSSSRYLMSFLYALFLGIFIEIVQYFLPYRSFDFKDIIANSLGSIVGIFLFWKLER